MALIMLFAGIMPDRPACEGETYGISYAILRMLGQFTGFAGQASPVYLGLRLNT